MFWKLYIISLPIFFTLDMLWLGVVAKGFYAKHLGFLMKSDIHWVAAILFYLLFIAGIVIFVLTPAVEKNSLLHALVMGALFGLITYATYDLTNLATLQGWPVVVTIIDLLWGATLAALVSTVSFLIARKIGL